MIRKGLDILHAKNASHATLFYSSRVRRVCNTVASANNDASSGLPWATIEYLTKKKKRITDEWGNLVHNARTIAEPAAWTQDAKMELAIQIVGRELANITPEELRANVVQLNALVPDLTPGPSAKHADLVRLAAQLDRVAENLLVLRDELPGFNVSRLAAQHPGLLARQAEELRNGVRKALELLAGCGPAGRRELLHMHPQLLQPAAAGALLDEIARLFGMDAGGVGSEAARARAAALLGSNPGLASAADCLRSQVRGDRDPEYLADTTRAAAS